jgi:hypothetical protein
VVYTTLDRLETKGFLRLWVGDPTPQRGGRRTAPPGSIR